MESGYEITPVLRVLFNADFFKQARFAKIKSPAEVVVGALRLVGGYEFPAPGIGELSKQAGYMGQEFMNPPSVEGWHTGAEWINSGSLMKRINFSADMVGDTAKPGIRDLIGRLQARGDLSPEQLVDGCLDLMGPAGNPAGKSPGTGEPRPGKRRFTLVRHQRPPPGSGKCSS